MRVFRNDAGKWLVMFKMRGSHRLWAGEKLLPLLLAIPRHWYVETFYGGWKAR